MAAEIIQLDWRGLRCPEPILKTARSVRKLKGTSTTRVRVLADDDAFPLDIARWCKSSGVKLSDLIDHQGSFEALLLLDNEDATATPPPSTQEAPESDKTEHLDCRGLRCPEPIMQIARKIRKLDDQTLLEVLADDDAFPADVEAWAKNAKKASLRALEQTAGSWRAVIEVRRAAAKPAPAPRPARSQSRPEPAQERTPQAPPVKSSPVLDDAPNLTLDLDRAPAPQRMARVKSMCSPEWANERVGIHSQDAALLQDILGWATRAGHVMLKFDASAGYVELRVAEDAASVDAVEHKQPGALVRVEDTPQRATFLVIHNDFESLMAAMMVANTSAAQGMDTTVFFSFWGVNLLRGDRPRTNEPKQKLTLIHRMFRWMMPKGATRQPLSKMHFGGVGKSMMLASMKQQNVMSLEQLVDAAIENGVRFQVCTMSMNIMGIQRRDIVEWSNIEFAGVASFVADAGSSDMSMVF